MVIIDLDSLRVNIPVLNLRYLFHCCVVLLKRDLSIISYVSVILLVCVTEHAEERCTACFPDQTYESFRFMCVSTLMLLKPACFSKLLTC